MGPINTNTSGALSSDKSLYSLRDDQLLSSRNIPMEAHPHQQQQQQEPVVRPLPSWFDESKFGIFVHWGIYSVPAFAPTSKSDSLSLNAAEWYARKLKMPFRDRGATRAFHQKTYGPDFKYEDFATLWKAEQWNPEVWAKQFRDAGARYVVFTSKHHDGFCNWPTDRTLFTNSSVKDTGPRRDLIAELSAAVRKEGLRFGLYFSLFEWYNSIYLSDKRKRTTEFISTITLPQLYELVEVYKPDVLWCDGDWEQSHSYWHAEEFLNWLYTKSPVKDTIVCNDRWGKDAKPARFGTFSAAVDRMRPLSPPNYKWECCYTIGKSWGHNAAQGASDYKSVDVVLEDLIRTVAFGGNFLLNVGPRADGILSPFDAACLDGVGQWIRRNSVAIFGTSVLSSKYPCESTPRGVIYFTKKEDIIFAILSFRQPLQPNEEIQLKLLRSSSASPPPASILDYSSDCKVTVNADGNTVRVTVPIALTFDRGPHVLVLRCLDVIA